MTNRDYNNPLGRDMLSLLGKKLEGLLVSLFVTNFYVFRLFARFSFAFSELVFHSLTTSP